MKRLSLALFLSMIAELILPVGPVALAESNPTTIDVGDTNFAQTLPTGVNYGSNVFTIGTDASGSTIQVTGTTNANRIRISSGVTVTLVLNDAHIAAPSGTSDSPIDLQGTANVTLTLADGTNNSMDASAAQGCAGIHAPNGTTLTVTGTGALTAKGSGPDMITSSAGAGIGGSVVESSGAVTITGGATVTATGGNNSAGIGGSKSGHGGTIAIGGGATVTATGGAYAPGIGGGDAGIGGTIHITGGTVTARGDGGAPGIGGGAFGNGGIISITGGTVIAIGDGNGAGIGGGSFYAGGVITIGSSAVVMAAASNSKPAIDAISGSSGSVINARLSSAISKSDAVYLKCGTTILALPPRYTNIAFSAAAPSAVKAYSNAACLDSQLLGSVVTDPAGVSALPVIDMSTTPAAVSDVRLFTASVNVDKDNAPWASGGPNLALATSAASTAETVALATTGGGVYTTPGLDADKTYYVWDTTDNLYTGISISSTTPDVTVDYYTVSLTSGTGIASTSGSGTYLSGADVAISATVSPGYRWSGWVQTADGAAVTSSNSHTISGLSSAVAYTASATVSGPPPLILTASLPDGTVGAAYDQTLVANSVALPVTWSISSGSLPAGLVFGASTGTISGIPTVAGTSTFTVQATDSNGSATKSLSITISSAAAPTPTPSAAPGATASPTPAPTATAAPLQISVSSDDGIIYVGGRITILPAVEGGVWGYDHAYLKRDGNKFTALKAGTTRVTYTVGTQTFFVDVTIKESSLPATGQNYWPALWLLGLALCAGAAAILLWLQARRKERA